jgi:hypothetical protein
MRESRRVTADSSSFLLLFRPLPGVGFVRIIRVHSAGHSGVLGGSIFPFLASIIQQFVDWMHILLIGVKVLQSDDLLGNCVSSVCSFPHEHSVCGPVHCTE